MGPFLSAKNLYLNRSGVDIYQIPSFDLHKGEVKALVGPNGAGKTSLILSLALLEKPTKGVIHFDGQLANNGNVLGLRRRMAVVFQESFLLDMTVRANLMTALNIRGIPRREASKRVDTWLDRFGIGHLARQQARSLSGGEAQRASLARAFAMEPELLFLDEPFASLDYPTRNSLLLQLGKVLKEMNMTTLFVTHDYSEIPYMASRAAVMYQGRLIKEGNIEEVFGKGVLDRAAWAPWDKHKESDE